MSITALTIINEALADLGVIRPGEVVSALVQADCLLRLNQRMSAHSIEQLLVQTQVHSVYAMGANTTRYTFGKGGQFPTTSRPEKLISWVAYSGNFRTGGMVVTFPELQAASRDALGTVSNLPSVVGADTTFPLMNVGVFPAPSGVGTLELTYWMAVQQFADLNITSYDFPDGWDDFLHFDLAMALLPRYGRQGFDAAALASNAATSKAKITTLNQPSTQAAA